jgi:hypothetical protein
MQVVRNLKEIVYEPINQDYGWGKYGEFKVLIRRRDGFVNITKLCRDGGKNFKHWNENSSSKKMVEELSQVVGIPTTQLMETHQAGSDYELSGTYVHQDLVPHIASWISPQFAIKVSRIVNNFIVCQYEQAMREKNGEISQLKMLNEKIEKKYKEEERRYEETKRSLDEARRKLDLANENIQKIDQEGKITSGAQEEPEPEPEPKTPTYEQSFVELMNQLKIRNEIRRQHVEVLEAIPVGNLVPVRQAVEKYHEQTGRTLRRVQELSYLAIQKVNCRWKVSKARLDVVNFNFV